MKTVLRPLRGRLVATFALMLLAGLVIFAAIAVVAIDADLASTLDARLATDARASATFVDVHHGRITVDAGDRMQFLTILGPGGSGIVMSPAGKVLLSTVVRAPRELLALNGSPLGARTVGSGDEKVRAFVEPIVSGGTRVGTVVLWRESDWIDETAVRALIAFIAAALVIAAIAWWAGGAIADRALGDAFERQRRFTADASHELRAPLAVIRAEADLALRRERDAASYRESMTAIASEADRMERLIGDLLSAARAESRALADGSVDLGSAAGRVRDRLLAAAQAKHGRIDVVVTSPAHARGDADAIERAVTAVVHNAVKHMRDGGGVTVRIEGDAHAAEATVMDDGEGFSTEALVHATERFWRGESVRSRDGSGLGLAIAKSIVYALGGSIDLSNRQEGGAAVRLRFPAAS